MNRRYRAKQSKTAVVFISFFNVAAFSACGAMTQIGPVAPKAKVLRSDKIPSPDKRLEARLTVRQVTRHSDTTYIETEDEAVVIQPGTDYAAWTFNDSGMGPSRLQQTLWSPDGRFFMVLSCYNQDSHPHWSRLTVFDTRTRSELRKDYITSRIALRAPDRISYMAVPGDEENRPRVSSRHSYRISDIFDERVPFVRFIVNRKEYENSDRVCNTLYVVRGKERARVPALRDNFGGGRDSTDWLGYPQEPLLSPDGKWLFCMIKVCHGNRTALLYKRAGQSLRYGLVDERIPFEEAVLRHYTRQHHLSLKRFQKRYYLCMVSLTDWDLKHSKLHFSVYCSDGFGRGNHYVDLGGSYDLVTRRFSISADKGKTE